MARRASETPVVRGRRGVRRWCLNLAAWGVGSQMSCDPAASGGGWGSCGWGHEFLGRCRGRSGTWRGFTGGCGISFESESITSYVDVPMDFGLRAAVGALPEADAGGGGGDGCDAMARLCRGRDDDKVLRSSKLHRSLVDEHQLLG